LCLRETELPHPCQTLLTAIQFHFIFFAQFFSIAICPSGAINSSSSCHISTSNYIAANSNHPMDTGTNSAKGSFPRIDHNIHYNCADYTAHIDGGQRRHATGDESTSGWFNWRWHNGHGQFGIRPSTGQIKMQMFGSKLTLAF
jgi:hypothetical protein